MDDQLLNYYERELTFIRQLAAEFARKYPKIAGRLMLEPDRCEDPHTERLIEAFAFLSGRIHKKIDDDFPEITESLLNIIYPHYVNPIPSMSIVKFEPMKKTISPAGHDLEKKTVPYSKPVAGSPCQFATTYPVTLWPIEVVTAELREPRRAVDHAQQVIVIQVKTLNSLSLSQLRFQLQFHLDGLLRFSLLWPARDQCFFHPLLALCRPRADVSKRARTRNVRPMPRADEKRWVLFDSCVTLTLQISCVVVTRQEGADRDQPGAKLPSVR